MQRAKGVYVEGTYDNLNRIKLRNYSDTTPDVEFYYDGKYRDISDNLRTATGSAKGKTTGVKSSVSRTNYTGFDNLGRLVTHQQITDGQTYGTSYTYNLSGGLISETYPSGRTVNYDINADGDLSRVWGQEASGTATYANSFDYNASGAVTALKLGNGRWETAKFNNRPQITEIGLGNSATDASLLKLELGYGTSTQNNGSLREQKITVPTSGGNTGFTAIQTYTYDDLNRIQSTTETIGGSQTWKQTFTIDRYGNRRFDAANTTTLGSCSTAVCNPNINTSDNRFSSGQGYAYDANGSVTQNATGERFGYDAENHQREFFIAGNNSPTPDATYSYDGDGRRVKKVSATETTVFVYNASGQLVAEYSTQISQTPQVSYLTTDHLGSPRVVTDQLGAVKDRKDFSAFGEETVTAQRASNAEYSTADQLRKDYTGYEKDTESGLEFAQARYYNPTHGRFTSVDPLTASASIRNPQTFNRYSYVLNSPYKFVDPLGLISETTGACGNRCPGSDGGIGGGAFNSAVNGGFSTNQQTAEPAAAPAHKAQQNAEPPPLAGQAAEPVATVQSADKVKLSVRMRGYDVTGSTLSEALAGARDKAQRGATPSGSVAETVPKTITLPNADASVRLSVTQDAATGQYTATALLADSIRVQVDVDVIMPSWNPPNGADNPDFQEWKNRSFNLANHEYQHVADIRARAIEFRNNILALRGTGTGATRDGAKNAAVMNLANQVNVQVETFFANVGRDGVARDSRGNRF